jgi:hypothetical protein
MSKNISNYGDFLGKSLYNLQPTIQTNNSDINDFLNNFINNSGLSGSGGSGSSGNQIFGLITSDITNTNLLNITQGVSVGTNELLRIIPIDQQIINDAFVYGVMITTNQYTAGGGLSTGYTSIKLDVPYVFNQPDHVPDIFNKEAPDNFLEISNSKFRVTGPFSFTKSIKTSFKSPNISLGYYDREESSVFGAKTLDYKTYDKGIVMERVENNNKNISDIMFSYIGYSQNLDRFVMYRDGVYTGTDTFIYPNMNGADSFETGILSEYNIGRNPDSIGLDTGISSLDIDTIYINTINSADHTNSRKLTLNSYDTMTINVSRNIGDVDIDKNFDYLLNIDGNIIINSNGDNGIFQHSINNYIIQSELGTYINTDYTKVPIYIGNESMININNYLQTTYISTGVIEKNLYTTIEFGGNFIPTDNTNDGTILLVNGIISSNPNNNIYGILSTPTINIPQQNHVNSVSNTRLEPINLNLNTNSIVDISSTLHVVGATTNAILNYSILSSQGNIKFNGSNLTDSYLSWENDKLNLYNSSLNINSQLNDPILNIGENGIQTQFYLLKRMNVSGINELFINNSEIDRIPIYNNKLYTISGIIQGVQLNTKICSFKIEYCLLVSNFIKTEKSFILSHLNCDLDVNSNYIFDVIIKYTGHPTNFVDGDCFTITGININGEFTNWFSNLSVTILQNY